VNRRSRGRTWMKGYRRLQLKWLENRLSPTATRGRGRPSVSADHQGWPLNPPQRSTSPAPTSVSEARWQDVLDLWVGRLVPGMSGAATHGAIRTAHAVRALGRPDTPERQRDGCEWVRERKAFLSLPVVARGLIPPIYRRAPFGHRATPWSVPLARRQVGSTAGGTSTRQVLAC
jgi:hypothetical protein